MSSLLKPRSLAMTVCSLGRAARAKAGIKVRQPLSKALVKVRSAGEEKALQRLAHQILDELNVKELEFQEGEAVSDKPGYALVSEGDYWVAVATELSPELEAEGIAREIVRRLQTMRRSADLDIAEYIITYYQGEDSIQQVMTKFADYIKQETLSRELISAVPPAGSYTEKISHFRSRGIHWGLRRQLKRLLLKLSALTSRWWALYQAGRSCLCLLASDKGYLDFISNF